MSLTNKFHTFVIVIISDKEIEIPEELRNFIINPEKPETMTETPEVEPSEKRFRGKKKEKDPDAIPTSFNAYKLKEEKKRNLSKPDIKIVNYSPCHLHIHVALKQTCETPGQVAPFVYRGLQILFQSGMSQYIKNNVLNRLFKID
jgi:hypothetical protein